MQLQWPRPFLACRMANVEMSASFVIAVLAPRSSFPAVVCVSACRSTGTKGNWDYGKPPPLLIGRLRVKVSPQSSTFTRFMQDASIACLCQVGRTARQYMHWPAPMITVAGAVISDTR